MVAVGLLKGDVTLDATETLITRGISLRGSWGRSIWETWDTLSALVVSQMVDLRP